MTLGGYLLGNNLFVRKNFEKVVVGIVLVSVLLPLTMHYLQNRKAIPKPTP